MPMRVRKLARELSGSSESVIGVLHALGFDRYRSPEDMLPDRTIDKVREAWRQGVQPVPVVIAAPTRPPADAQSGADAASDLMSRLVPGVVPVGKGRPRAAASPAGAVTTPSPVAPRVEPADPEAERRLLTEARAQAEALRGRVAELEGALAQAQAAAHDARSAADHAQAAAADARTRLDATESAPPVTGPDDLVAVLGERGLRGLDEMERALGALARSHHLRDVLPMLRTTDPAAVARVLATRLILTGGPAPDSLAERLAVVTVAPERSELPDVESLSRHLALVGERLLLYGYRRALVVGGRPLWHRLLRDGIDPRIEMRFAPGATRGRSDAESDVLRVDVVILWDVEVRPEAREVYETARAQVIEAPDPRLPAMLAAVQAALSD